MTSNNDFILLKWGTLKGWCVENNPKTHKLMEEYCSIGVSQSVMLQKDSPRQKEILLQIIDLFDGPITNDWTGETYASKDEAKKYLMEYGKEKIG